MKNGTTIRKLPALIAALCLMPVGWAAAQTFTNLHSFTGVSDGNLPVAGLILSGNTLYGTAHGGGSTGNGTVFKVSTDGTGFTNLHSFATGNFDSSFNYTNSDGANPHGKLFLSGDILYGTTFSGGFSGAGTIFAINTNGAGFRIVHSFPMAIGGFNSDGCSLWAGLILAGNTLYGTAFGCGSSERGTVFKLDTSGTGFTTLHTFNSFSTNGSNPYGGLVLSGSTLYGTTQGGGSI